MLVYDGLVRWAKHGTSSDVQKYFFKEVMKLRAAGIPSRSCRLQAISQRRLSSSTRFALQWRHPMGPPLSNIDAKTLLCLRSFAVRKFAQRIRAMQPRCRCSAAAVQICPAAQRISVVPSQLPGVRCSAHVAERLGRAPVA